MNRLKTPLHLSFLTVLMVLMGSVIGGKTGMVFSFFMAAAMNFFSCRFPDKIVLSCMVPKNSASTNLSIRKD